MANIYYNPMLECLNLGENRYNNIHVPGVNNKMDQIEDIEEKLGILTDMLTRFNNASKEDKKNLYLPDDDEFLNKAREHFPNLFQGGVIEWKKDEVEIMKQNLTNEVKKVVSPAQLHMMQLNNLYQDTDKIVEILQQMLKKQGDEISHILRNQH